MRNLKRALSLALASVMLLGMMVVGTGASYADVTSEDNKEAIEVLQTIGVMVGDNNGNFNPDAMVTREQMAVIMCNLLDYTVSTYKGTTKFTDVSEWALPYVEACYTNGIIAGYSETQFGGNDSVTTSQAALMILKALGYFQEAGDFGSDWVVSTIRVGAQAALFDGVDNGATEALTRNDVAQIVLNALKAECVMIGSHDLVADGKGGFTTKAVYVPRTGTSSKYNAIVGTPAKTINLGEELYNGTLTQNANTTDAFGRPATKWSYKSTTIGTFADQPIATYTAKASKGTLYDLVGSSVVSDLAMKKTPLSSGDQDKLVVYVDGVQVTTGNKNNYFGRNSSDGGVSGNGVLTEVYLDNNGNVTLVYVNTYLMQATNNYSESKGTINVSLKGTKPSGLSVNALDIDDFDAIADFKADDYILYTASQKSGSWEIQSVAKAEVVTGTVEAFSTGNYGYVKIDGTQYDYALKAASDSSNGYATEYVVTDTASVVVDANGYVLYVDNASISVGNYVFIKNFAEASSLATKIIADATFTDGTKAEITIKEVYHRSGGTLNSTPTTITGNNNTKWGGWYAYTKNSKDEYTLKQAVTTSYNTGVAISNGKATISSVGTANADTIFLVKKTDGDKALSVYTGITNVPSITNGTVWAINAKDDSSKKLSVVYVEATKNNIDNAITENVLFLLKHDSTYVDTADNEKVYVWNALLNGEEVQIKSKTIDNVSYSAGQVFEDYSIDSEGYYEAGNPFANGNKTAVDTLKIANNHVIALSGNTLTIGGKDYIVDDDTIINLVMLPAANANGNKLKNEIMTDDNAKYETGLGIDAGDLEGRFDGYKVTGKVYASYVDDKSDTDLLASVYVVITAVQAI
ncbi:S-layer homology domain-containing protein [Pseudoflavonifractor sp. AF19-9AC]|uniref:S-layer homology domain-containing protein n=1 Tax=Pseudoflavonifractor sp. AF19-9AC TaxID=2292244 RepID=UPI001314A07F|nr:S-layer homology domain-containing protein [Pseudoflavonifractor sp. AF19-9AC]